MTTYKFIVVHSAKLLGKRFKYAATRILNTYRPDRYGGLKRQNNRNQEKYTPKYIEIAI